jgi:hypothetical protein
MQVYFESTNQNANTHCCVCGQGFALSWERKPNLKITDILFEIQKSLCDHHHDQKGPQAHPQSGIVDPDWNGRMIPSVAIMGNARMSAI